MSSIWVVVPVNNKNTKVRGGWGRQDQREKFERSGGRDVNWEDGNSNRFIINTADPAAVSFGERAGFVEKR